MLFYLFILAVLVSPCFLVVWAVSQASILGRCLPGDEERRARKAVRLAVALNLIAIPLPLLILLGVGLLYVPAASFGIAAAVAGAAGRRPFLFGGLSCPWFSVPVLLYWIFVKLPTENADWSMMTLVWFAYWGVGLLGAGTAALILARKPAVV